MKATDIKTASTAQLVAFYNLHADRKVKKFQDRATAEKRVAEVIEMLPSDADFIDCPDLAKIIPPTPESVRHEKKRLKRNSDYREGADEFRAEMAKLGADVETPKKEKSPKKAQSGNVLNRAASIAHSWLDENVAALRKSRMAVKVFNSEDGLAGEYKSVPEAFRKLGLPWAKMVQFRGQLRRDGKAQISIYTFKVAK